MDSRLLLRQYLADGLANVQWCMRFNTYMLNEASRNTLLDILHMRGSRYLLLFCLSHTNEQVVACKQTFFDNPSPLFATALFVSREKNKQPRAVAVVPTWMADMRKTFQQLKDVQAITPTDYVMLMGVSENSLKYCPLSKSLDGYCVMEAAHFVSTYLGLRRSTWQDLHVFGQFGGDVDDDLMFDSSNSTNYMKCPTVASMLDAL